MLGEQFESSTATTYPVPTPRTPRAGALAVYINTIQAMYSSVHGNPVEKNPDKLGGKPVFRGTRIPISILQEYLEYGRTVEDFVSDYDVSMELADAVYQQEFSDDETRGRKVPA